MSAPTNASAVADDTQTGQNLSSLQKDTEVFAPSEATIARSYTPNFDELYAQSIADPEAFWEAQAHTLEWISPWSKVLEWTQSPPSVKWFVGAQCNITLNALDRHVENGRRNKAAFIWVGEDGDAKIKEQIVTYGQLLRQVNQCANALKDMGVKEGDRVTLYMALTPELPIAMLACARIGAVHCVVYGGFSAPALRSRIEDSESKVVICSDIGYRRGKRIDLKGAVDEAVRGLDSVEKVLVHRRGHTPLELDGIKEIDWCETLDAQSPNCEAVALDAEAPLFFLYTSGTTGKPKGIIHTHGGYSVGTSYTHRICFDLREDDIYFCTADPGWITGHSYVTYGPLINGATVLLAEGALDFPDPGRWWSIIQKYGVNIFYSTPTAIRALMRFGDEWPAKYDLSSIKVMGSVGEPINPEAWLWYHKNIGREQAPIVDTWWQTETGQFMISTVPSYPTKPGSPGKPLPGIEADVVDKEGNSVEAGKGGFLVIKKPWPGMMRAIYRDQDRYNNYWDLIPGFYAAGDVATKDEDGYIRVMGRADDVMNVSGYRIGTAEVESALVSFPAVAEAAVIGKPDSLKGETIKAFVILRQGFEVNDKLLTDLKYHVRTELSPIAIPSEIDFVDSLPKTRSGKIMRRVLKAKELGVAPGDISTLED
ncbi:MAG TPA: acetate--CoA ligase [Abditibacteriaceae bacterium]|jgi:acetyl-CoA synthetase